MTRNVICPICKKEFITIYPNQKYCSKECSHEGQLRKQREWHSQHKEYLKELKQRRILESAINRCSHHFNNCKECPHPECRFD